jgi:cytochrome c oxidase cbb3-type subunit IV
MELDINTLRSAATVACLFTYIGIVVWAWSRRNQAGFEQAANLPFDHDQ